MILAAECAEGLGGAEFVRMATRYARADDVLPELLARPVEIDQWQVEECAKVARWCDVVLVSRGIPEDLARKMFIRTAPSVEDAIADALQVHGPEARIAVIPRGPYTLVEQA
jgi:nickel-dependent lactate racemase